MLGGRGGIRVREDRMEWWREDRCEDIYLALVWQVTIWNDYYTAPQEQRQLGWVEAEGGEGGGRVGRGIVHYNRYRGVRKVAGSESRASS